MAGAKRILVGALAVMAMPALASDGTIGADFIDANLYGRLYRATHGSRGFAEWLSDKVVKKISVVGQESFAMHLDHTEGDLTAYANDTAFGQGNQTFTNVGQMTISGNKVAGFLTFSESFADSRYQDPADRRFTLSYERNGVSIDAGNINASLVGGNQFLSFTRQLVGVDFRLTKGALTAAGIASEQRSSATTVSFNGNNSSGPYYLQASQLDPNSVRVQVDGKELNYPTDFTVNAVIGSITFTTLSIAPTSTIVVSYESTGINSGGGTITGLGLTYSLGKLGSIGALAARQTDPSAGALSVYVDRFQGYGDPSVPYILQYTPLPSKPILVTLDGVNQVQNVDYQFSATNPTVFYFLRYVPNTSTITVTYTPEPSSNLGGDRQVEGFNYTYPFGRAGRNGGITYSEAFSHLSNPVTPLSGTARGLTGSYKLKNFSFTAMADDVPQGFVGIDSTGFLRNEKSTSETVEYKLKRVTLSASDSNAAVSTQTTDQNGNLVFLPSRTTRADGGARYAGSDGLTWSFDQQHLTSWSIGGESVADESAFSLAKMIGKLNTHLDLNHTTGSGPISNGLTTTLGDVRVDSIGWRGDYQASHGWNFGGHATLSAIDTAGTNGTGTDMDMSLSYRPMAAKFGFDVDYAYSNSGQIATLGQFQDGAGLGYNGNGFSSGVPSANSAGGVATGFNAGGTDLRRFSTSATWNIAKRAAISANFMSLSDYGAIGTDSSTIGGGLSVDYDLHNGQSAAISVDQSNTNFAGATGNASSLTLNAGVYGRPKGPWSYRLAAGALLSSGGTVAQNSYNYQLSLKHYLKANQAVGFDVLTSNLTNYQPQNDFQIDVSYEYRLFKTVSILGKYQLHSVTNLDPTVTTGAFNSRGFDVELNFSFGS